LSLLEPDHGLFRAAVSEKTQGLGLAKPQRADRIGAGPLQLVPHQRLGDSPPGGFGPDVESASGRVEVPDLATREVDAAALLAGLTEIAHPVLDPCLNVMTDVELPTVACLLEEPRRLAAGLPGLSDSRRRQQGQSQVLPQSPLDPGVFEVAADCEPPLDEGDPRRDNGALAA
jgi:hypothetical protein